MSKIEIKFEMPDFSAIFKKHQNEAMQLLAATMQANRSMMFDKDGADNGKEKWADLVLREGRPLQKTGALRLSMAPNTDGIRPGSADGSVLKINGVEVKVGSKLAYAPMMNDGTTKMPGGVLRPKYKQALKIPLGNGKFMFRKSVKIPARPMDTISNEDAQEFSDTLANYFANLLRTGGVG